MFQCPTVLERLVNYTRMTGFVQRKISIDRLYLQPDFRLQKINEISTALNNEALFVEPYAVGTGESEKYIFPDLTEVSVTINSGPNMLYNNGIESKNIWEEVNYYRLVAKKITDPNEQKMVFNWSAGGSSILSAAFSSASLGSTLSVVGLPTAIPLGVVGGCFAVVSSRLIIASNKLDSKIKKKALRGCYSCYRKT